VSLYRRRKLQRRTVVSAPPLRFVVRRPVSALQLLEDRRLFHPGGALRMPRSFFTRPRLVISPAKRPTRNGAQFTSPKIGFSVPRDVAICVRRKTRKEVIIAKKLARNGGGSKHFNIWSEIKC